MCIKIDTYLLQISFYYFTSSFTNLPTPVHTVAGACALSYGPTKVSAHSAAGAFAFTQNIERSILIVPKSYHKIHELISLQFLRHAFIYPSLLQYHGSQTMGISQDNTKI